MRRILLTVLFLAISSLPASSQTKDATAELPGATRVAVVNIGYVFNHYVQAKEFKTELERGFEPFKMKAKKLSDEIKEWQKIVDAENGDDIGKLQAAIVRNKRELEDLSTEMQRVLGKKQEDNLVTLWKEVQDGIKTYATSKKIDLVLGYGDPLEKGMMDLFPNINRKMQSMDSGGAVPLFASPRTEIAPAVTDLLNARLRDKAKKE